MLALGAATLVMALAAGAMALLLGGQGAPGRARVALEMPVTAMDRTLEPANNSPLLVADPNESRFVVMANRLDAPDFSCALQVSGDGGKGWAPARPVPKLPPGAEKCYAPEVAFDREGTLYYLFVGLRGRGNSAMGVFITSSRDRGRTFSPPHRLLGPRNYMVRMAIDRSMGKHGRIHIVWLQTNVPPPTGALPAPPNPILSAFSDDGGKTFSRPTQVNDPERKLSVAPALALGPDHAVHVLYYDLKDDRVDYQGLEGPTWPGPWSVVSTSSYDGGRHFGRDVVVDDRVKPPERVMLILTMAPPALAVHGKRICAAWTDARQGDRDILSRCSETQGRSWEKPRRVNDDRVGNGASQYLPHLSMSPDGRLDAIFYDRRLDPANIGTNASYTFSTDGGRHFAPNLRLAADSFDPRIGQQYAIRSAKGQVEFGSRLGLLARRDGALAAWADTRNSLPLGKAQDIFSAKVEVRRSSDPSGGLALGALVLGVAGVLTLAGGVRWRRSQRQATGGS